MEIFNLVILIPIIILCTLGSILVLMVTKLPISIGSVLLFTVTGGMAGVCTMILFGLLFSNDSRQLTSVIELVSMFLLAGLIAVVVGTLSVKVLSRP